MKNHHSIIVIGAGLSGLYTAWRLHQQQKDVVLLEARDRIGGRILSTCIGDKKENCVDLGPAWVWPQLQPRLNNLFVELDIKLFNQFTQGDMLYEASVNNTQRHSSKSSHSQSYRIAGGSQTLVDTLAARLPDSSVYTNFRVISIDQESRCIKAQTDNELCEFSADDIILALPTRIAQQSIEFKPPLSPGITELWRSTPTWMAGHCKMVFIYKRAFWREQGLSGEVFSHLGPLSEIYDGSPANESFYALTAFVGLAAQQRQQFSSQQLIEMSLAQLQRLFGDESKNTEDILIQDWSRESFTSTDMDIQQPANHPTYSEASPRCLQGGHIIISGTETAREHGGYLEGALESADDALSVLAS